MSDEPEVNVVFDLCCFCNEIIAKSAIDPSDITVTVSSGQWQTWWCHAECFRKRLHSDPLFEPVHF